MQAVLAAQGPARKEGLGRQTSRQHRCRQHAGTQQKQQGEPSLTSVSEALPALSEQGQAPRPGAPRAPTEPGRRSLARLSYVISGKSHTHASKPTVFTPLAQVSLQNHPQFTPEPHPLLQDICGDCLQRKKRLHSTIFLQENKTANYEDPKKQTRAHFRPLRLRAPPLP